MTKFTLTNIVLTLLIVLCVFMGYMGFSYWWLVLIVGVLLYSIIIFCGVVNVSWNFFMPIICKIPNNKKQIFLSFDDGPQEQTEAVLDFLKKHDLTANFFCIGKHLEENPSLAQRLFNEGHFIGNHSALHEVKFPIKSTKEITEELEKTNEFIYNITGKTCYFFRPPFGITNPRIAKAVANLNMVCVGWNIRSFDTKDLKGNKALPKIIKELKSGDIVLLHDHSSHILSILEGLVLFLNEQGFSCQRIDHSMETNN